MLLLAILTVPALSGMAGTVSLKLIFDVQNCKFLNSSGWVIDN